MASVLGFLKSIWRVISGLWRRDMDNYEDLEGVLTRRFARSDLAIDYPELVGLAEKEITTHLRVREMQSVAFVYPANGIASPPDDFIWAGELRPADSMEVALEYVPEKQVFAYERSPYRADGVGVYSIIDKKLYIKPKPPGAFWGMSDGSGYWGLSGGSGVWGALKEYWLRYFARPDPLGPDNDTNVLFPLYSDIYLYAALAQGFEQTRNYTAADRYRGMMMAQIGKHNDNWKNNREGEGSLQMSAPIVA